MKNQLHVWAKPEPGPPCHCHCSLLPFPLPLGFSRHQSCALAPNPCYLGLILQWGNPRWIPGSSYAFAACPSSHCKPRNVPAQWGHLTPRGGRDKQGTVLYLAYLTVEMIVKMALAYIALTQQVLILCYLGGLECNDESTGSVTSTDSFICY